MKSLDSQDVQMRLKGYFDGIEPTNCARALLKMERAEHAKTRKMYEKADHDRKRYRKRLDFVAAQHALLCDDFHRMQRLNATLENCVSTLERRLMGEQGGAEKTDEVTAWSSGVCEDDQRGTDSGVGAQRDNAG